MNDTTENAPAPAAEAPQTAPAPSVVQNLNAPVGQATTGDVNVSVAADTPSDQGSTEVPAEIPAEVQSGTEDDANAPVAPEAGIEDTAPLENAKTPDPVEKVERQMPVYRSNERVSGLKIREIIATDNPGISRLEFEDTNYGSLEVTNEWLAHHKVHVGGYYLVNETEYKSFAPAEVFESRYSLEG